LRYRAVGSGKPAVCFSPEADVAAGVIVGAIGLESLRHVHRRQELLIAALPLVFGAHQLSEAFVWWGLRGQVTPATGHLALWLYMTFAFVILPVLAPLAVFFVEPSARRQHLIGFFAVVGAAVSVVYANAMIRGPISGAIHGRTVAYSTGVAHGGATAAVYIVAMIGALIASSHRRIALFGWANVVGVPVLILISARALTSLWCVWAAVASIMIAQYQRLDSQAPVGLKRDDAKRRRDLVEGA
jgi:hypothetical protein